MNDGPTRPAAASRTTSTTPTTSWGRNGRRKARNRNGWRSLRLSLGELGPGLVDDRGQRIDGGHQLGGRRRGRAAARPPPMPPAHPHPASPIPIPMPPAAEPGRRGRRSGAPAPSSSLAHAAAVTSSGAGRDAAISTPSPSASSPGPDSRSPVEGAAVEQLLVGARVDDPPLVEHDDAVGQAQRRAPVGDEDRRPADHQPAQGRVDLLFDPAVDRRGGVVEQQDPRVGEERPGERDPLALAAREQQAPFADDGVVAVGQLHDEPVRLGGPGRRLDLRRRSPRAARRRCWTGRCRRTGRRPRTRRRSGGAGSRR